MLCLGERRRGSPVRAGWPGPRSTAMETSNLNRAWMVAALSLAISSATSAQVKSWNAAGGNWGTAGNWSRAGLPGPANLVFIGNTAIAENAFVTMNVNAAVAT